MYVFRYIYLRIGYIFHTRTLYTHIHIYITMFIRKSLFEPRLRHSAKMAQAANRQVLHPGAQAVQPKCNERIQISAVQDKVDLDLEALHENGKQ